jgi:hypothetical protein
MLCLPLMTCNNPCSPGDANLRRARRMRSRALFVELIDLAQVFAEAEAADASLERGAVAAEEALEKRFELERTGDVLIHFGELSGREFFPSWADGGVVAETAEEELDFGEGEIHFAGETDEEGAIEGLAGITALAAGAMGRGQKSHFFVVADGGGVEIGAAG